MKSESWEGVREETAAMMVASVELLSPFSFSTSIMGSCVEICYESVSIYIYIYIYSVEFL